MTVGKTAIINHDVFNTSPHNNTRNSSGILRRDAPVFEPKTSLVVTPWGVNTERSANNAAGALRGDAPVFHPKASGEETEVLPKGLVGTPVGVKTAGHGA